MLTNKKGFKMTEAQKTEVKKELKIFSRVKAYVKDKTQLFEHGNSERSKAIMEVLTSIRYIIEDET